MAYYDPTVVPMKDINVSRDAGLLMEAIEKKNKAQIIKILTERSLNQRLDLVIFIRERANKELQKELATVLDRKLEKLVTAMITPLEEYFAKELHLAMDRPGTNDDVLIEMLCPFDNRTIQIIREAYMELYERELIDDVEKDTIGNYKKLLLKVLSGSREVRKIIYNDADIKDMACKLYSAGEGKLGTDEDVFIDILTRLSFKALKQVVDAYNTQAHGKRTFEEAIKSELSGYFEDACLAIVKCCDGQSVFFAERIMRALKNIVTSDSNLIRLIVSRSEIDLGDIKREFKKQNNKSLYLAVSDATSGEYRDCLLALIGCD